MKYNGLISEVMDSINEITCDLNTKQYQHFLELLRNEIDQRIDNLDDEDNEDEDYDNEDYEYEED